MAKRNKIIYWAGTTIWSAVPLELAKSKEDEALVGKQAGSFPFLGLGTDDCFGDFRRMKELG